jgi:hypothetical protein
LDAWQIFGVRRDNVLGYPSLQDLPELLALLGIRPQNEDRMRHSAVADKKTRLRDYKVSTSTRKMKKTGKLSSIAFSF